MYKALKTLCAAALLAVTTTLATVAHAGDTLQRVVDFQTLKVGMSADQPPMNMKNREGGIMGFDVDLAQALAAAMQVKLEIKPMPFGELMKALEKDEIDMIISGMSITPQRTELVSFVGPYMMSGKSILTRSDVLAKVTSTEEFNRADLKLVALSNSTSASFVSKAAPEAKLIEVANYDDGVKKLMYSEADAMVADMPACILAVLRNPGAGFATLDRPLTVEPIGIAISKDDAQFQNLVQNYLRSYEKAGILNKLREKWFEDNSWVAALP